MAITTKKKRKRVVKDEYQMEKANRKLLIGSRVEVRSLEQGLAGSWHCGTVVACRYFCRVVQYDHFYLDDEGSESLKEMVHVSALLEGVLLPKGFNYRGIIRPIPPPCENVTGGGLNFGLCVDAFIDNAWWEGVIFSFEDKLSERLVFFPDFPDRKIIKSDELRVTQDWDEVEECWTVRGKWKFLELIEDYPIALVKAAQIWHDLKQKEGFKNNIKEWTCNVTSMWVDLVVETVSQNLDISSELIYKVISEKTGNYSVNEDEECGTNRWSSCDNEEAVTMQIQDLSISRSDDLKLLTKDVTSSSLVREIDDGAHEGMEVVVYSYEGYLPTCDTANREDEAQGVGTVVECTVNGSSSVEDDDQTYGEPRLKRLTNIGSSQKKIQTPADSGSTGKLMWLPVGTDVIPEAKYFPEALEKYLMPDAVKIKNNDSCARDLRLKAKMHLSYMGWTIEYRMRPNGKRADLRYISPEGRTPLYSLRCACLRAIDFPRRRQVPLSMICREDKGCASTPVLCLKPEPLYSDNFASDKTPHTRRKLNVHVEPEYCPQAVRDYMNGYQCNDRRLRNGKNVNHLREKVKKHLSAEGWTFSLRFLKDNRRDFRYTSPSSSVSYKSLVAACEGYVKEVAEFLSPFSHDKFLSTTMHPEVLRICYTKPSGASRQPKVNPEVGIIPEKRTRDEQLKRKRNSYSPLSEENSTRTKVSRTPFGNECNPNHVPRSSKRARQVVVPRSGHCSPRTILNWLIENDVVLPRAKVRYLSVRDDSAIGQGKINPNGIKCSCCQIVFGLYKFGLHVGSCYTPPSARIYLEDGRSLLDCQKQLQEKCSNIYAQKMDLVHKGNDEICSICHHGGTLLLCDQCPSSFHLNCLGLEDVPVGNWFCPSCRCRVCGQQSKLDCDSEEHPTEKKVLRCDQCNHEYHVECVRETGLSKLDCNNQNSNWFCSIRCEKIYVGLNKLLGESVPVGKDNLSWTILKSRKDARQPFVPSEIEVAVECQSKLNVALAIMHECFEPIKDTRRDLIEDVIFNKTSDLNRLNFWGFYAAILEREDELISVAAVRIHDEKFAEVPLVCTRVQHRMQGMCRTLLNVLGEKLGQLEVERVILPAIPQVLQTWTTSFGFSTLTNSERLEFLPYTFLDFQDTRMCQKFLRTSPVSMKRTAEVANELPRESNADGQQFAGTCTHVDALAATVFQAERLEWSQVAEQEPVVEVGAKSVPGLLVAARPLDVMRTVQDESGGNWQNCEPCIAGRFLLDDKPHEFYSRRKMLGAHVHTAPAEETSDQLTTPHIDGSHSCQDVVEGDRTDTFNSQELGLQKKRKRLEASSSGTVNKLSRGSNEDVGTCAVRAATRASEESEKRTPYISRDPCCQDVSEEGTSASPSEQLEKPTSFIGCQAASEEDDLKRDSDGEGTGTTVVLEDDSEDDAVESQVVNLDCGTEELENSDSGESFTQLVDDLKRQGFDDSVGEIKGMTLVLKDDTPTSSFKKRRLCSACEPSMKDDVVVDTDPPAENFSSGSLLKSCISEAVVLWGSSEAATCIEAENIFNDDDNEMADAFREPISVISACDESQNMKEGRYARAVSVVKRLSYGDTSISNGLVRFNNNDIIDGAKDSLPRSSIHEPARLSYFADSHDDSGNWSESNDTVDKFLSLNDSNLSQEVVPEKTIKEINFSASRLKGTCELAKRRTTGSPIRDISIFDFSMHDTPGDGEPGSISCKSEAKDGNGMSLARRRLILAPSDSRLMSDELEGARQMAVTSEVESNLNSLDFNLHDAGFDSPLQRCKSFGASKIPAEPSKISNELSTFVSIERAIASVMEDVGPVHISEESEQAALPYTGRTLSDEEDTMTTSQEELVKQQKKRKRIDESSSTSAAGKVDYLIEIIGKHLEGKEDTLKRREIALEKQQISLMKLQMDLEKQRNLLEKKSSLADGLIKALAGLKDVGRISVDEALKEVGFKASELIR
ncbi:hypothetical protein C5167_031642 [Papaver somniferum]|uniref:PHD-type domain-containing protein n=1 Tax=Papaver somniferum TaxID=3469 RepID=A0A4Y7K4X6_PAPSO|nr:uncharacterized protein LOC113294128 [Papaver somniferum]RZC68404.1 hypothetical protein C5167_031642 [Papaver somniferum]